VQASQGHSGAPHSAPKTIERLESAVCSGRMLPHQPSFSRPQVAHDRLLGLWSDPGACALLRR